MTSSLLKFQILRRHWTFPLVFSKRAIHVPPSNNGVRDHLCELVSSNISRCAEHKKTISLRLSFVMISCPSKIEAWGPVPRPWSGVRCVATGYRGTPRVIRRRHVRRHGIWASCGPWRIVHGDRKQVKSKKLIQSLERNFHHTVSSR